VRGQRHAPAALYSRERPGTHCTGNWVGLRTGLDRNNHSTLLEISKDQGSLTLLDIYNDYLDTGVSVLQEWSPN
jgi:hypothetical protein